MTIIKSLEKIGIQKDEATMYVALLELGEATAAAIAKKTGFNRSTAYVHLKSMELEGLVSSSERSTGQVFSAKNPQLLIDQSEQAVKNAKSILPDLLMLAGTSGIEKPRVQFFQGIEGVKTVLEDTLTAKEEIRTFGDADLIVANLKEYYDQYIQRRIAAGIRTRAVLNAGEIGEQFLRSSSEELRSVRLVPRTFAMPNEIKIYDGKVAIMSHKSPYGGILIHNMPIYETQKSIFEMAWQFAEPK